MKSVIIVGSGRGLMFAHIIQSERFQRMGCRVAAMVEVNAARHGGLRSDMDMHGMADVPIFSSLHEALDKLPYAVAQSVIVVAPNRFHADCAGETLVAGRHLLLEKPVAADWSDAKRIAEMAATSDRVIQLGFVLRYSMFYRKLREIAATGVLGNIVMIASNERLSFEHSSAYRRGWRRYTRDTGGLMNEKCSHDLDIMNWMKKDQAVPVEVFSIGGRELFPEHPEAPLLCADCTDDKCLFRRDISALLNNPYTKNMDVEPYKKCIYHTDSDVMTNQSVTIRFSDGTQALFTIMLYAGSDEQRDIRIMGTEGQVTGDLKSGRIELKRYRENTHEIFDCIGGMHGGGDAEILADFFRCIDEKVQPEATVHDGVLASKIAFAANISAAEHRIVKLSELV